MLNTIMKYIRTDAETFKQLKETIRKFSFSHVWFKKFEEIFQTIEMRSQKEDEEAENLEETIEKSTKDFFKKVQELSWLAFTLMKEQIYKSEPKQKTAIDVNCCFMASAIQFVLMHTDHSFSFLLENKSKSKSMLLDYTVKHRIIEPEPSSFPETPDILEEPKEGQVEEASDLKLNDLERFLCLNSIGFSDEDNFLLKNAAFKFGLLEIFKIWQKKSEISDLDVLITKQNISVVYHKLETIYQRLLSPEEIDETSFIKDTSQYTPIKCTPFVKHSNLGKVSVQTQRFSEGRDFNSHRFLFNDSTQAITIHSTLKESARTLDFANKSPISDFRSFLKSPFRTNNLPIFSPASEHSNQNGSIVSGLSTVFVSGSSRTPTPRKSPWMSTGIEENPSSLHFQSALQNYHWLSSLLGKFKIDERKKVNAELADYLTCFEEKKADELLQTFVILISKVTKGEETHGSLGPFTNSSKDTSQGEDSFTKGQRIYSFFLSVLTEILKKEEQRSRDRAVINTVLKNENFLRALLALCAEAYFFIINYEQKPFMEILTEMEVTPVDFWKNIIVFCKFDRDMPTSLQKHLIQLEFNIMFEYIWRHDSQIYQTIESIKSLENTQSENQDNANRGGLLGDKRLYSKMAGTKSGETEIKTPPSTPNFKKGSWSQNADIENDEDSSVSEEKNTKARDYDICAMRVMELSMEIGLDDDCKENVWTLLKYIISEKKILTCGNHLDQLMLCSFFAVGKMANRPNITFKGLFEKYQNVRYADKRFTSLQQQLVIRQNESGGEALNHFSVVNFYNNFFLAETDECIKMLSMQKTERRNQGGSGEGSSNSIPCFGENSNRNEDFSSPGFYGAHRKNSSDADELPPVTGRSRSNSVFSALMKSPLRESLPLAQSFRMTLTPNRIRLGNLNSTMTPTSLFISNQNAYGTPLRTVPTNRAQLISIGTSYNGETRPLQVSGMPNTRPTIGRLSNVSGAPGVVSSRRSLNLDADNFDNFSMPNARKQVEDYSTQSTLNSPEASKKERSYLEEKTKSHHNELKLT